MTPKPTLVILTDEEVSRCLPAGEEAGFGALTTARGPLPLKALDVQARIDGLLAAVEVTQTFVNTHAEPLEATYIFPLPDRAAVTSFRLEVAGRVVEGVLQERGAARREYDRAIQAGHRAAIAEEERPDVFTLRVGNLPPGETAAVHLRLTGPLAHDGGEATFRFPLVVALRYIPGAPLPGASVGAGTVCDTDAVPDASRISPPVLLPGFPNPIRLSLLVDIAPSHLPLSDFRCSLHAALQSASDDGARRILLQPGERADRDFILRFRVGDGAIRTALTLTSDADGAAEGTFALTVLPPAGPDQGPPPRDIVFVLDRSGSMAGWKIVAARRALGGMVESLTEHDRFTVYAFDNSLTQPPEFPGLGLQPATARHRFLAAEFLAGIGPRGGTEMAQPLALAVHQLAHGKRAAERILVLVTDGQVGNEDQILRRLAGEIGGVRVLALGIDRAVNAGFLRRLADLGGGTCELVESEKRLEEVLGQIHRHLGAPVLTGLRLQPVGFEIEEESLVPARLPDLFAGAPLTILGRYRGGAAGSLRLSAATPGGERWSRTVVARVDGNPALPAVWARGRLRDLEDRFVTGRADPRALEKQILDVSLRFGVLCRFTSFVAVDRAEVVNEGGCCHQIVQPVDAPSGWAGRRRAAQQGPSPRKKMRKAPPRPRGRAVVAHAVPPSPLKQPGEPGPAKPLATFTPEQLRESPRCHKPEELLRLQSAADEAASREEITEAGDNEGKGKKKPAPGGVVGREKRPQERAKRATDRKKCAEGGPALGGAISRDEEESPRRCRESPSKKKKSLPVQERLSKKMKDKGRTIKERPRGKVTIKPPLTVRALSEAIGVKHGELLFKLMNQGVTPMPNINSTLDPHVAELLALDYGVELELEESRADDSSRFGEPQRAGQSSVRDEPAAPQLEAAAPAGRRLAAELLVRFKAGRSLTGPQLLRELRGLAGELKALRDELVRLGATRRNLRALQALLADLTALLEKPRPDKATVARLWARAEKILRRLAGGPAEEVGVKLPARASK
jgi:Ca-activated chloride channel homolog